MIDLTYKAYCFWRLHGTVALLKVIYSKLKHKLQQSSANVLVLTETQSNLKITNKNISVLDFLDIRFQAETPLHTYLLPDLQSRRVNVITDSVGTSSLFGGVGTALIFAALLANKLNAQLRIITRTERAKPENVEQILSLYGITLKNEIQFTFAAFYDQKYEFDIFKDDLFITTSWWTTAATLPSVPNDRIIYLLQEDERMFYPFGDDRYRCEAILRNHDIRFLINTKLLFDHFVQNGFDNIASKATWFEPAFPVDIFYPRTNVLREKRKFIFYARPNNPRNLFYLGMEVIYQAVLQNVLDLEYWDIYLVGKDIPSITFSGGYTPIKCENFSWSEYAELAGTIDLGLSLMYTPHPSYPPLDLVASGAVVVTNRFANKFDLSGYSQNLICAELNRDALVDALRKAVDIAINPIVREKNYKNNQLITNWEQSLEKVINQLSENA